MKLWNKQYWNGVLALTLGWSVLGQCGAAENATACRDWKNSNGEIALRGALDVERALDEAPSEGAPNRVYFIDESGVSKYYRYRHLSAEDREIVDEALDAPASPVSVPTEEAASAATKPNQAADVAAQNSSINGGVSEDEEETLAKLAALTDDARVAKERDGYKAGIAKLDKLLESAEVATDAALFEGVTVLKASWEKLNKYFPQGLDAFRSAEKAGEQRSLTINGVEFPFRYCPS